MADRDYLVTARKYRPSLFKELVAQGHVADTLKNALRLDRLAHAYLFSGPRGVGKTTAARILAKAINCETPQEEREDEAEPCCECESCVSFEEGRSLNVFEMDAASNNKVDDIRELREKVRIPPQGEKKKVYILDEVHMLSKSAFNALLKTLEEPPDHALFIFATTEPHKVLPTILSRCQRFDFRRIPVPDIVERLREVCETEGVEADEESLMLLARKGNGALRDALSAFDQAISLCGDTLRYGDLTEALGVVDQDLYFDLTDHVTDRDTAGVLELVRHVVRSGYDLQEFLVGLAEHLRHLLVARSLGPDALTEVAESTRSQYAEAAEAFGEADLLRLLTIAGDAEEEVKNSPQPRLKLETTLLKMAQLRRAADLDQVLQKIDRLEQMAEQAELPEDLPATESDPGDATSAPDPAHESPGAEGVSEAAPTASTDAASAETADKPAPPHETTTPGAPAEDAAEKEKAASESSVSAAATADPEADNSSPEGTSSESRGGAPDTSDTSDRDTDTSGRDTSSRDAGREDHSDDGTDDDPDVGYDDLFGAPALEKDPSPSSDEEAPPKDTDKGPTNADGGGNAARSGGTNGPQAQVTAAEPPAPSVAQSGSTDRTRPEAPSPSTDSPPTDSPTTGDGTQGKLGAVVADAWPKLVQAVRGNHIRVGLFLEEAKPVELRDTVLTVSVPRALHRDTLLDHRSVLLEHLDAAVEVEIADLEVVVDDPAPDPDGANATDEPASPREQLQDLRDTYPALDVLFREFEAEPIW